MLTYGPERERQYRQDRAGRRRRTGPPAPQRAVAWLRDHVLLTGLLAALLVALLSEMPWVPRGVRTHLLQGDVVGFGTLLGAVGLEQTDLRLTLRRGIAPWLMALMLWCVVCTVLAPYRALAVAELLRMILCAEVFLASAYGLRRDELKLIAGGVLTMGMVLALYGVFQFGSGVGIVEGNIASVFGNHEPFGSFLALLLPVAAALALDRSSPQREQLASQSAALVTVGALLLTRTRSAWLGGAAGLITLILLALRYSSPRLNFRGKVLLVGPLLVVLLAFAAMIFAGQIGPLVSTRAATMTHVFQDPSFADRMLRWRSACRMVAARPVAGWGLGTYPVLQSRWTHEGDSPAQVLAKGTGLGNIAHNFWVQWAAETGGVGLALYVAAIFAFLALAFQVLRARVPREHMPLLIGCIAVTVGSCVDATGAPTHTFPGISALFWFWIGLGVAACRGECPNTIAPASGRHGTWLSAGLAGVTASLVVIGIGIAQH